MKKVSVSLGSRSYDIFIGNGLLSQLGDMVRTVVPSSRYFFVIDQNIEQTHGQEAIRSFDVETNACSIEAIEKNKTIETIQNIWNTMLKHECDRGCPVVAIGGGLVGDVGGFAAASFMRGVTLVQIPTTLLGMVDASIGGKTGINVPLQRADGTTVLGKNLAGAFWQPKLVVADVATLQTLDDRQLRCGLAECVKHAMLGHHDLLGYIQKHSAAMFEHDPDILIELVTQCAQIKADVVSEDEREAGSRALLNLGHTFAHVIEPLPELSLFHGEAVSIGLCAAVSCAEAVGLVDADLLDQTRTVLTELGLPTRLPMPVQVDELLELMKSDKKAIDGRIRLVLPTNSGAKVIENVEQSAIGLAWASVGASL